MALDLPSYLLGKSKGGGGGTLIAKNITKNGTYNASDDSADGYSKVNVDVSADVSDYFYSSPVGNNYNSKGIELIKQVPSFTIPASRVNLSGFFGSWEGLIKVPEIDTSKVVNMSSMFSGCKNLPAIPQLNTSRVTNMQNMFFSCQSLISVPELNTSIVTNMQNMFYECLNLTTIPQLNTSRVTNMQNMFSYCPNLSDTSLDNILQMCANATSYTRTKTLSELGFTSKNYSSSRIQALPHYQDFIDAGWQIGY